MSAAFASRLAQLIGLPTPTPNKHDQDNTNDDNWYTPYTGPYEPPPSQLQPSISPPPLDTYSGQEHEDYFAAYPHPYSYQIARRTYHEDEEQEPDRERTSVHRSGQSLLSHSMAKESKRRDTGQGTRRGSVPSFLSGSGGIGESPVAPHAQVAKVERAAHRTSLASFMTFGGRRASHTPQVQQAPLSLTLPPYPASAQPAMSSFPETMLPSPARYHAETLPRLSVPPSGLHAPPVTRKRTLTHSGFYTAPRSASVRARAYSQADKAPQSFFDTSVLTKAESPVPSPAQTPAPTPIERASPMGAFAHPFATAYLGPRHAPPVRPNPKPESMRRTRPPTTSAGDREREREGKGKGKQRVGPGLALGLGNQARSPPVRHAIKTSVSTPNLREEFHQVPSRDEGLHQQHRGQQMQQQSERRRPPTSTTAATSRGGGGREEERALVGQSLCDTFFFPRPRLQAHTITPPLTPETNLQQTWSSPQPNPGPPRPTMRPRANSFRWLRREPSAELRPPLPRRSDSRTEVERVIAEGERLDRLREQWRDIAERGLGSGRERDRSRSRSRSRKNSLRSTKTSGKEGGAKDGHGMRVRAKSLRGKLSMGMLKPRSNSHSHSNSNPQSQAHTSSGGTYTTTTGSGGTGGTHSRGPSSGGDAHHSRHNNHHQGRNIDHVHSRTGSWSQTAIRRAQSVCVGDSGDVSPGVEKVLDPTTVPRHAREVSDARKALAMVSPEVRAAAAAIPTLVLSPSVPGSTETGMGIGLAISAPPVTQSFTSTSGGAKYAGPHTTHRPTANIVTRHRLPPRANVQTAQTLTPVSAADPEPPRESWMIYGSATEEDLMRNELQAVKEGAEAWSVDKSPTQPQDEGVISLTDAFRRRSIDDGLGSEEVHQSQSEGLEDMTFAAGGTLSRLLSSANVSIGKRPRTKTNPDSMAGTISSVSASRPVSTAPSKSGFLILEDEEAEAEEEEEFRMGSAEVKEAQPIVQGPALTLSPLEPTTSNAQSPASSSGSYTKPPPAPLALPLPAEQDPDKSPVRTPASRASHRRTPSEAKSERSWGRVYASENIGGPRSGMSSLESSPKMSPRPLGGVDDLEGYKDLFYRPMKTNTPPDKSNTSLALVIPESSKNIGGGGGSGSGSGTGSGSGGSAPGFGKRPELLTFDSVRSGNSSASISGRSLSAISAEVETQRARLEELEREHGKRWGSILQSISGGDSPVPPETFDPDADAEDVDGPPIYIEGDGLEGSEERGGEYLWLS